MSEANSTGFKLCRKCCVEKQLTEFYKAASQQDGIDRLCKVCRKQATLDSKARDPQRVRLVKKEWRQKNKNRVAEQDKASRLKHREKRLVLLRQWRQRNKEQVRQSAYKWRAENPEKYKATVRKSAKQWRSNNPEAKRAEAAKRRAQKRGVGGSYTKHDISALQVAQRNCCAACKTKLVRFHVDHVVPLSAGGSNDRMNLQLLCPPCNLSKGARDPLTFMQLRGYLC